ncbi:MAG: glycosyltransferase [Selenomonadaceae bacterium]|nr:glycosyltransferase [Selenomonadaceae bacterium]
MKKNPSSIEKNFPLEGETKILLVLICESRDEIQRELKLLRENRLFVPEDENWKFEIVALVRSENLAVSLNKLQTVSDADFKIYLNAPLVRVDGKILRNTIYALFTAKNIGMLGLVGSEIPVDGDFRRAKNVYGLYSFVDETGKVKERHGIDALFFQPTQVLDSGFFATSKDLPWDENIGADFLVAAQCCRFRENGFEVGVAYQENCWLTFARDYCDYVKKPDENYHAQLEQFRQRYGKNFAPLVSILIPAYNKPEFLREALDSALAQTYANVEILIGDDSTNEDVKNMIQPYLAKYPRIQYFYHGGPLGNRGRENIFFLLNHCRGEFVNFLLHDDLFYPKKISRMMEYFARDLNGEINLVASARDLIDENSSVVKRKNPWQPHRDAVLSSVEVGRQIFFTLSNFLGELSTVLFRKRALEFRDFDTGGQIFSTGCFCGIAGSVYGDLDAWLQILSRGGKCVFIAECLSAFRLHGDQNTYDPYVRTKLPLDMLTFTTIAWLNNLFLRDAEEYSYCLDKWLVMAGMWVKPESGDDSEKIRRLKKFIVRLMELDAAGNFAQMFDGIISYMLEHLPERNPIRPLVRKNLQTGLWEKAGDGILPRCKLEW